MRRDFDLIRRILFAIADVPPGSPYFSIKLENEDKKAVLEHIEMLIDGGLVEGKVVRTMGGIVDANIRGLTWAGQDFLDSITDDTIWNKAKTTVLKPAASFTFGVLLEWLKAEAKQKIGLP